MIVVVFFTDGVGFDQFSAAKPNMDIEEGGTRRPRNIILRYFLIVFLFLMFGYA